MGFLNPIFEQARAAGMVAEVAEPEPEPEAKAVGMVAEVAEPEEWKPFTEAQPASTYVRRWTEEKGDDETGYYHVKRSALETNPAWTAWNNRRIAHLATRPDDYDTEKWREFTEPAPTKTRIEAYQVEVGDDESGNYGVETRYRNVANPAWAAWNARKEENFKNRPYDRLTDEEKAARNDEEVRKKIEEADKEARRRLDPDYVPPADTTPGGTTPSPYTPESLWGAGNVPMGVPGSTYTAPPPTDLGLDFYTPPPPTDVYSSFGTAGITGVTDPTKDYLLGKGLWTTGITGAPNTATADITGVTDPTKDYLLGKGLWTTGISGIEPGSVDPLAGLTPFQMGGIASLKAGAGALQDYVRSNLSSGIGGHGSVLGSFS